MDFGDYSSDDEVVAPATGSTSPPKGTVPAPIGNGNGNGNKVAIPAEIANMANPNYKPNASRGHNAPINAVTIVPAPDVALGMARSDFSAADNEEVTIQSYNTQRATDQQLALKSGHKANLSLVMNTKIGDDVLRNAMMGPGNFNERVEKKHTNHYMGDVSAYNEAHYSFEDQFLAHEQDVLNKYNYKHLASEREQATYEKLHENDPKDDRPEAHKEIWGDMGMMLTKKKKRQREDNVRCHKGV
jgi:hypothetical protein